MNLLEQYIVEIISVDPYLAEWTRKFPDEFVIVEVIVDCYGGKQNVTRTFTVAEWEKYKEQGYWME